MYHGRPLIVVLLTTAPLCAQENCRDSRRWMATRMARKEGGHMARAQTPNKAGLCRIGNGGPPGMFKISSGGPVKAVPRSRVPMQAHAQGWLLCYRRLMPPRYLVLRGVILEASVQLQEGTGSPATCK